VVQITIGLYNLVTHREDESEFLKMNTNAILGDRELWVEAHLVMQVFYYNDSGEEDWTMW
jgi:hypothetical protein